MTPFIFQVLAVLGVVATAFGGLALIGGAVASFDNELDTQKGCSTALVLLVTALLMFYLVIYLVFPSWFAVTLPAQ